MIGVVLVGIVGDLTRSISGVSRNGRRFASVGRLESRRKTMRFGGFKVDGGERMMCLSEVGIKEEERRRRSREDGVKRNRSHKEEWMVDEEVEGSTSTRLRRAEDDEMIETNMPLAPIGLEVYKLAAARNGMGFVVQGRLKQRTSSP